VNVSSGTGSPGLSLTKSKEPYNGCVCVILFPQYYPGDGGWEQRLKSDLF